MNGLEPPPLTNFLRLVQLGTHTGLTVKCHGSIERPLRVTQEPLPTAVIVSLSYMAYPLPFQLDISARYVDDLGSSNRSVRIQDFVT